MIRLSEDKMRQAIDFAVGLSKKRERKPKERSEEEKKKDKDRMDALRELRGYRKRQRE